MIFDLFSLSFDVGSVAIVCLGGSPEKKKVSPRERTSGFWSSKEVSPRSKTCDQKVVQRSAGRSWQNGQVTHFFLFQSHTHASRTHPPTRWEEIKNDIFGHFIAWSSICNTLGLVAPEKIIGRCWLLPAGESRDMPNEPEIMARSYCPPESWIVN